MKQVTSVLDFANAAPSSSGTTRTTRALSALRLTLWRRILSFLRPDSPTATMVQRSAGAAADLHCKSLTTTATYRFKEGE